MRYGASVDPRPLDTRELCTAGETLAAAFDGDPLFRFLLPAAASRARWLRWIQTLAIREAHAVGGAWTLGGPERAVMGVFPDGTWPRPFAATLSLVSFPPSLPPWPLLRHGPAIDRAIRRAHVKEAHLYLYVLGVHPAQHGKGLGAALVRHARALAGCRPTYLETSNEANLPFYRRLGFQVLEELGGGRAPRIWTMRAAPLGA
jgi:ribosomal protein S18 acetylase RimI-like enzyme